MTDKRRDSIGVRLAVASCALATAVLATAWVIAGALGLLYLAVLAAALLCGLPWGLALFGSRHAAGWLAGALFGYWGAGFLWWLLAITGGASMPWWIAAWVACTAASWRLSRRWRQASPLVALGHWTRANTLALVLTMALVPILVARPFSQIGRLEEDGSRRYRAYFTADFVWHMALVEELTKHTGPPTNPYLAPERLHYYWTYFLVPSALTSGLPGLTAANALALNALACGLLFTGMLYLGAWAAVPGHGFIAALAVAVVMLCGSVEGAAALGYGWWQGWPVSHVRGLNIDALPAWAFHGLRIDNLPRALWYTPQHAAAFALGTIATLVAMGGAGIGGGAIALAGIALGIAMTLNPFVGAVFAAVYGIAIATDAIKAGSPLRVARHLSVAIPVALALVWCDANQITSGSGSSLVLGWWGPATHGPVPTLAMSFLPAAIPAIAGVALGRSAPETRIAPALAGLCVSLILMFTVALRVDPHWVGFRTGHLIFGFLPPLVAWGYVRLREAGHYRVPAIMTAGIVLSGLPTTVIDAYDAQDVANTSMGPGFHWTLSLSASQQDALSWIQTHTPSNAIVQAEPTVRGREAWSVIPSFAGRRMAAGLPISLMHVPAYDTRSRAVQEIYASAEPERARLLARELGIDFLYVDGMDRATYPAIAKFDRRPDWFEPVFRNREVTVYATR